MAGRRRSALLLGTLVAFVGCDPNLGRDPSIEGTSAMFDPTTGVIPLPNNALLDPTTGMLAVPADPSDSELTQQVKAGLGIINGWIPGSMITIPFDGELDPTTLNEDTVRLYDVTESTAVRVTDYYVAFNVGRTPATAPPYNLFVRRKSVGLGQIPDFELGHRYIVVVTDAIRDVDGQPVLGTTVMELLKSRTPLVNEYGRTLTILPDADAAGLESMRAGFYAPALDEIEGEVARENIVAHTVFTIQSNPMPSFNPMPLGKDLPAPIGDASPANDEFSKPWACFLHPIDTSTAAAGAKLYKRGASLTGVDVTVSVGKMVDPADTTTVLCEQAVILDGGTLEASTTYQVVLTDAIKGVDGVPSRQSAIFSLMAKTVPLFEGDTLNSPFIDSTFDALISGLPAVDPTVATQEEWDAAYETMLGPLALGTVEQWRKDYQPYIADAIEAGTPLENLTATWVFTTAAP
jgi:Bacterial virulence factor lipase N-terminal